MAPNDVPLKHAAAGTTFGTPHLVVSSRKLNCSVGCSAEVDAGVSPSADTM